MSEAIYIDGEPLSDYGGQLVDWKFGNSLTNSILTGKNNALPSLLRSDVAQGTLTATIHVTGRNTADAHMKASRLICRLNKTADLQMPDGMLYRSALSKCSETEFTSWITELSLEFTAVPHGSYVEINPYVAGTPIAYDGTAPAGAKIEFDAPADIAALTLKIIRNLETKFGTSVKFSDSAELYRVLVTGNQTQTITHQGKNLFDAQKASDFNNYASISNAISGGFTVSSTSETTWQYVEFIKHLTPATTYYISCLASGGNNPSFGVYDNSGKQISGGLIAQFVVPADGVVRLYFYCNASGTVGQYSATFSNIMLSADNSVYEPFVPECPSFDYPAPIHGVTKITVNGVDYALPRELFTDDYYEVITGQGQAKKSRTVLNGTQTGQYYYHHDNHSDFTIGLSATSISGSEIALERFSTDPNSPYGCAQIPDSNASAVFISNVPDSCFGITSSDTDDQAKAKITAWFEANPNAVVYPLATPQPITGTPIPPTIPADTLISADNGGTITATSGNTQQDIQLTSIPSGSHISINGIDGKITQNGVNKFADSNLVDFPSFDPSGETYAIQTDPAVSNLKIGYYPAYL